MRSAKRTRRLFPADRLLRDIATVAAATGVVGVSFGAMAASAAVSPHLAIAMSMLVFAGGSQFLAVGILGAGGGAATAVLAGLLLNARHLPFGLALGETFDRGWLTRLVGSHLMIDESVAFALAQGDPDRRRRAYWLCGAAVFVSWNLGTAAGVFAGRAAGDPAAYGLDAAFPAGLLALMLPSLRERTALRTACAGAAIAVLATPLLPPGLPLLTALLALVFALPLPGRRSMRERAAGDRGRRWEREVGHDLGRCPASSCRDLCSPAGRPAAAQSDHDADGDRALLLTRGSGAARGARRDGGFRRGRARRRGGQTGGSRGRWDSRGAQGPVRRGGRSRGADRCCAAAGRGAVVPVGGDRGISVTCGVHPRFPR